MLMLAIKNEREQREMRARASTLKRFSGRWRIAVLVSLLIHGALVAFSLIRESNHFNLQVDAISNRQQMVTLRVAPPSSTPNVKSPPPKKRGTNSNGAPHKLVENGQGKKTTQPTLLISKSNNSERTVLSNTSKVTTGLAATSSVLLPNGDSSFSERQRIIGSQGLLE
jgi:hypothetical protein